MVSVPPMMAQKPIGISSCDCGISVRLEMRETTGMNSAVAPTFCIMPEIKPTIPETSVVIRRAGVAADTEDPARNQGHDAGTVQAGAQDHDRDDGNDGIGGEAIKQAGRRHQPQQPQQHHHGDRDDVHAQGFEYEQPDGDDQHGQHQHHVRGERQTGFHSLASIPCLTLILPCAAAAR